MNRTLRILAVAFCLTLLVIATAATAQQEEQKEWTGKLADGTIITRLDLDKILQAHTQWIQTHGREGASLYLPKARLSGVDMSGSDLRSADLRRALMDGANLTRANLVGSKLAEVRLRQADVSNADLSEADLSGADLSGSNLNGSWLFRTNLSKATLVGTSLGNADLDRANLSGADLTFADLRGTNLGRVDLSEANLTQANLRNAALIFTNLRGANLLAAYMNEAKLCFTNLSETNLSFANLSGADLSFGDLSNANMGGANLHGANLRMADMSSANMKGVELSGTRFDLKPGCLPNISSIAYASNLYSIKYEGFPAALEELREGFRKAGLRRQEREVTYAIEHAKNDRRKFLKKWFVRIAFEWTCDYGMAYLRPLGILLMFIICPFFPCYLIAVMGTWHRDGIWKAWDEKRILTHEGEPRPQRVPNRGWGSVGYALYFSILSAFRIGWRGFDLGNWLVRMQKSEYTLNATGWVRTVAGIQSLISFILVVLFVLVYFGRPFQ